MNPHSARTRPPQAFVSSYAPRIRTYGNSILTPVVPQTQIQPLRTTKRGTTAINYAEDGYDDSDFDDSDGPRRPTGLRSIRRPDDLSGAPGVKDGLSGKEISAPVELQGIWRDWMGKPRRMISEKQAHVQPALPLTLIPIRIDVDIAAFRPEAPLPVPNNARDFGIDDSLPAYKPLEQTTNFKLRDAFLWNLHEALLTPDQFAKQFVDELDFPTMNKPTIIGQISRQIREQLEEYAGVALHPLFSPDNPANRITTNSAVETIANGTTTPITSQPVQPPQPIVNGTSAEEEATPTPAPVDPSVITATATQIDADEDLEFTNGPPDTHRCILSLSFPLRDNLYTDRFEWSLLHPPGVAEIFAAQTCADIGLAGEWVPMLTHAIYEAVLRLKKDVCEKDGVLPVIYEGGLDNDAVRTDEGAGWRFDSEGALCARWAPAVEVLSKEDMEKREGDRERQLRRVRRETARFTSSTTFGGGSGNAVGGGGDDEDRLGRGERSKKKRRFRSLSPLGRDTPDSMGGGGSGGYGGGLGRLDENQRQSWRCGWCRVWGAAVWAVRDGPGGANSLCHNCGLLFEREGKLPPWSRGLFASEGPAWNLQRR